MFECHKENVLGGKKQLAHEWVDKTSSETTNKAYSEYKQYEQSGKFVKTVNVLCKYRIHLCSTRHFHVNKRQKFSEIAAKY